MARKAVSFIAPLAPGARPSTFNGSRLKSTGQLVSVHITELAPMPTKGIVRHSLGFRDLKRARFRDLIFSIF
jgi:hypothetical protein